MAQELKDYDIMDIEAMDDERLEKSSTGRIYVTRVNIKDEVDAVLAELKKNLSEIQSQKMQLEDDVALLRHNNAELRKACNDKDDWCLHTLKENRHHKYKRCLAMAKWCYSMDCRMLNEASDNGTYFKESWCWKRALWYGKWKRKWLELAEKFKEAK